MRRVKRVVKTCYFKWIRRVKLMRRLCIILFIWIIQRCCSAQQQNEGKLTRYRECGGTLDQPAGLVMTPNYPEEEHQTNQTYPNSLHCQWTRNLPFNNTLFIVRIWFMMLENGPVSKDSNQTKCYDYLNISIASIGTQQLCRWKAPAGGKLVIRGVGPSMSLDFVSDESGSYVGVMLAYNSIPNYDPCVRRPCRNGLCKVSEDRVDYLCECEVGFTGRHCEVDINECGSSPCLNGGVCKETPGGGFSCICQPEWSGKVCDEEIKQNPCLSQPCEQGATCEENNNGTFRCICKSGYAGDTCSEEIDECHSSPCLNGGRCFDFINSFNCACSDGWSGATCEEKETPCASEPCGKNQTCIVDKNNKTFFRCECSFGWTGEFCDTEINECHNNPCLNGGTCLPVTSSKRYKCRCRHGHHGNNCEIAPPKCQNPGILELKTDATFSLGETLQFFCSGGFRLQGPSKLTCTRNGTWSGDLPVCVDHLNNTVQFLPKRMRTLLLTFVVLGILLSIALIGFGAWTLIEGPWNLKKFTQGITIPRPTFSTCLQKTPHNEPVSNNPVKKRSFSNVQVAWA